jgi:hypothetical protein
MIGVSDPGDSSLDLLLGQRLPVPDPRLGVNRVSKSKAGKFADDQAPVI